MEKARVAGPRRQRHGLPHDHHDPGRVDEFVRAKLQAGGFDSPAAFVTAAPHCVQGQEVYRDAVEQLLLEAIDSPRIPWGEGNFDRIIE